MSWRLLITRPAEECAALAAHLAERGVFGSALPLLAIEPLAESPAQLECVRGLERYCVVIVVSKPAARLGLELLGRHWPQLPPALRWFAVGVATGELLHNYGVDACWPEKGDDSEALLALPSLQVALQVSAPRVLILRGETGRDFLAERLRGQGVTVDYLPLYRRACPAYPAGELLARVRGQGLNGLVVSSGEGLANLHALAGEAWSELAALPLFVPSPRVAELARALGASDVIDCRGASAPALLAALDSRPAPR